LQQISCLTSKQNHDCEIIFNRKQDPAFPPATYTLHLAPSGFVLFPRKKKNTQKKTFCRCGRDDLKNEEALKSITWQEYHDCFENGKHVLTGSLHQTDSTLKSIQVLTSKNKYTIFYDKIPVSF